MITTASRADLLAVVVALIAMATALVDGGAGARGQLVARVGAFAALALALVFSRLAAPARRVVWMIAALAGLAALATLQSLRLPLEVARLVAPTHAELTVAAHRLLETTPHGVALSLAPDLSRGAALAFAAAAAVLFAGFVAGGSRRGRRILAVAIVVGGLIQILVGARTWLAGTALRLHGAFVNPNHLAYALEIALAVAFAWAIWAMRAQRFATGLEGRLAVTLPPVLAWLALAAGLLATGSRAGLAAAACGLLAQGLMIAPDLRRPRVGVAAILVAALVAVGGLALEAPGRLAETTLYEVAWGDRAIVWRRALDLWLRFPWTGSGLGTFGEAFALVQPAAMTELYWRRAHNDPIELLATGGVAGAALGAMLAFAAVRALRPVLVAGERSEDRAAALAALGAAVAVAFHELLDFGLTLPGIAWPLAALVGAAAAAPVRTRSR